jgi:hypothetical protein
MTREELWTRLRRIAELRKSLLTLLHPEEEEEPTGGPAESGAERAFPGPMIVAPEDVERLPSLDELRQEEEEILMLLVAMEDDAGL